MCELASDVFGVNVPGGWLFPYMVRRFGWPNSGSDDHKDLCAWLLTTPVDGVFLRVSPYFGGGNLHFSVRFTEDAARKFDADPGRERFFKRKSRFLHQWWKREGRKLYCFGFGLKEGDEDELVLVHGTDPTDQSKVLGYWRRTPKHGRKMGILPTVGGQLNFWIVWSLSSLIEKEHPKVRLPKITKREKAARHTKFNREGIRALSETLRSLLVPTSIRDLSFNILGNVETGEIQYAKLAPGLDARMIFPGAGVPPEALFALPKNAPERRS